MKMNRQQAQQIAQQIGARIGRLDAQQRVTAMARQVAENAARLAGQNVVDILRRRGLIRPRR